MNLSQVQIFMNNLLHIVSKLSKSSAESVHTFNNDSTVLFNYLHIETEVEKEYQNKLNNLRGKKSLIFLCGSSGDGKSAIIAKHRDKFSLDYNYHVDATHSFMPNQTAIEALEHSFSEFSRGDKSLVVGINIGIMMNYSSDENTSNFSIKSAIQKYIDSKNDSDNIHFINFEDYSKFDFDGEIISSSFIKSIIEKITASDETNPFYSAHITDQQNNNISIIHQNYKLLSQEAIQNTIIELLITIHLKYDQFLTTRSLLDFIYTLLNDEKILTNQLFEDERNPIIQNIRKEDPILKRSFTLDKFILDRASGVYDSKLKDFIQEINALCNKPFIDISASFTLIRFFYLFQNATIANDYHKTYAKCFDNHIVYKFIQLVSLHNNYDDSNRKIISEFYQNIKQAILAYINKSDPDLSKGNLVMQGAYQEVITAVPIEISPDWSQIKAYTSNSFSQFPLYLKINREMPVHKEITLNLYSMIMLINGGYRPNKHDRNTIIIFDELIQSILEIAYLSNDIYLIQNGKKVQLINNDEEIEVISNEA